LTRFFLAKNGRDKASFFHFTLSLQKKQAMKTLKLLFVIVFLIPFFSLAQNQAQLAPVNPDFTAHQSSEETSRFTSDGYPLGENPSPTMKFFDPHSPTNIDAAKLGSSYDLRDINGGNWLSPVRDQGLEGACWAFATYGAVESYWLKNGLSQEDLSEQNMVTCHGFDWLPSDGGNYEIAMAYLARQSGPIDESDDPYTLPNNPNCVTGLTPTAYINQARYLPGINDAGYNANVIKQTVLDQGAIYVNMRFEGDYMNYSDNTYYYDGTESTNHGVLLVGWDDDKVVTGNNATPSAPGAWIIRNSWGPSWGESGYFYISYEDTKTLTTVAYFPSTTEYNNESDVYGYDELGWCASYGYDDGGDDYALIKFTASADQVLESVGSFITTGNSNVDITVYDDFDGTSLSTQLGSITNQYCEYPGYYSFDFSSNLNLGSGDDFYVQIRYYNSSAYPVPVEYAYPDYSSAATFETGKCWLSTNGSSWDELGGSTGDDFDLCIKAYATDVAVAAPVADFNGNPQTVVIGSEVQFTDISTGVPDTWTWTFEDADVTNSNNQHPSATWSTVGTYDVTLTAENAIGSNSITKTDYITVVSAPITCESMSNVHADDNIVYYTATDGYISGHNGYNFMKFAERFENPALNSLNEITFGVAKAYSASSNPIITIKVWDNNGGLPGTEIHSENKNIADFTEGSYNTVELSSSVIVPETFFVGYEIYYETPQDTFAVYMAQDRGDTSPYSPTAYTYYGSSWNNLDDVFTGGFNTAYVIELELCPAPPVASFSADQTEACENLNVQFTDESLCNPDSWLWEFGDGNTSIEQHPSYTYSSSGTYTVALTATNTLGNNTYTATDLVEVHANPSVNLGGDIELCLGEIASLDAGAGMSDYNWSPTGDTQNISVSDEGIYAVTITDANGCTATDQMEVSHLTAPTVELGADVEACDTETPITLDAGAGMTSYAWTPSGNSQTLEVNSSGNYSVIVENANGCTATDEIAINILPAPNPNFDAETMVVCEDETPVLLNPNTSADYTYLWSTGDDSETISVNETNTYSVTVSYGTCSAMDEISLTVYPLPAAFDLIGGGEIEEGADSEILLADSEIDVTYYLSHDMDGEVASAAGTGDQLSFGLFSEPGIYTASAVNDIADCNTDMNGSVDIIITDLAMDVSEQLNVFPNPVKDVLMIDSKLSFIKITLYSSEGKAIKSFDANSRQINFSDYSNGVYFIEFQTTKETIRKQIVKNK
jgi:C1A family cysteine protease